MFAYSDIRPVLVILINDFGSMDTRVGNKHWRKPKRQSSNGQSRETRNFRHLYAIDIIFFNKMLITIEKTFETLFFSMFLGLLKISIS